jgi:hypothetical protein
MRLSRRPEEKEEPLIKLGQLTFAQLFRDLDEAEHREEYHQRRHEHGGLLSRQPSRDDIGGTAEYLYAPVQVPAGPGRSRGMTALQMGDRFRGTP